MPNNKNQFERYRKIHDRLKLRGENGATLSELLELCEISRAQFMIDKSYMIDVLTAPIKYSRKNKSFYYTEDFELSNDLMLSRQEFNKLLLAFETLSQFQHLEAYQDFQGIFYKIEKSFKFKSISSQKTFISFEKVPSYKGTEHIDFFLEAIEYTKEVSFNYHSFHSNETRNHILQPYIIKEHTNRWYVIGLNPTYNKITTFALDRIKSNLNFTSSYYNIPIDFDIDRYHSNVVGLTVLSEKPIERVVLHFTPLQSQYFISKPFHQFKSLNEDETGLTVEMNLIPNYELIQKLASFGSGITVLEPQILIDDFKHFLQSTLGNY
jgi:predicted DNA-binding transcriptional regulator YafY